MGIARHLSKIFEQEGVGPKAKDYSTTAKSCRSNRAERLLDERAP